jgi:hypothetical protein
LQPPVIHRRVLFFVKPDTWIVCDVLTGTGEQTARALLHLRPDCALQSAGHSATLVAPTGATLHVSGTLHSGNPPPGTPASHTVLDTWYSESYGEKTPSRAVSLSINAEATLVTCATTAKERTFDSTIVNGTLVVGIEQPRMPRQTLIYRLSGTHECRLDGLVFDGEVFLQRATAPGAITVWASDFRRIEASGRLQIQSGEALKALTLTADSCVVVQDRRSTETPAISTPNGVELVMLRE